MTASSGSPNLVAGAAGDASVFASAYVPNAGTLQLKSTGQFVTADASGASALSASRATASSWERFTIRPKAGAGDGVYTIKAASNGLYVAVAGDGSLVNSAADEGAAEGFLFVAA